MIASGGSEQKGLGDRIPSLAFAFEKESADSLRARRSPRLAGRFCRDPSTLEGRHEKLNLSCLTGALAALDRNKPAARRGFRPMEVQCRWPQTR
jgi:hypothetical protein